MNWGKLTAEETFAEMVEGWRYLNEEQQYELLNQVCSRTMKGELVESWKATV